MQTENLHTPFQNTKDDLSQLKATAVDASKDLGNRAAEHLSKGKIQLESLGKHVAEESCEEVERTKVKLSDLTRSARDYVSGRPMAAIGTALVVGFLFGVSRARRA